MSDALNLKIYLSNGIWLPKRYEDAGYDLVYPGPATIIGSNRIVKLPLGVYTSFSPGWVGFICDKSSLGSYGLKVFGGVIDSGYRGEWCVILGNFGEKIISIKTGQSVAQVLFFKINKEDPLIVVNPEELGKSERGTGGFGSMGR